MDVTSIVHRPSTPASQYRYGRCRCTVWYRPFLIDASQYLSECKARVPFIVPIVPNVPIVRSFPSLIRSWVLRSAVDVRYWYHISGADSTKYLLELVIVLPSVLQLPSSLFKLVQEAWRFLQALKSLSFSVKLKLFYRQKSSFSINILRYTHTAHWPSGTSFFCWI